MGAVSPRPLQVKEQTPCSPKPAVSDKPSPITRLSVSKTYVVPPRPKPGRKPSNDTPPSRRKAQNRDAQRAFRERKSQAVKALEEQLARQAQEFERQQLIMREQILQLQRQNQKLIYSVPPPNPESPTGVSLQRIQSYSIIGASPPMHQQPQAMFSLVSPTSQQNVNLLSVPQATKPTQPISPEPASSPISPGTPFGTPVTPADVAGLELLDHVLEQKLPVNGSQQPSPTKSMRRMSRASRSSTESPNSPGVVRKEPPSTNNPLDLVNTGWSQPAVPLRRQSRSLEVDFTLAFTPRSPRPLVLRSPPALKDRCGFCTDNTLCICAASAAREEGADMAPDLATLGSPLMPRDVGNTNTESHSPRAEEASEAKASQTSPNNRSEGECTGNPSNCSQCRHDPMLTLFCSAVANKAPSPRLPALGTFIPAQAAYKTLSRHPRFAFANIGEVVEILMVKRSQVEVNSVAKVLRLLDTK